MKKYGTIIALGFAVIFGALAVMLVNNWMTSREAEQRVTVREPTPLTRIVIAAQDLSVGARLTAQNLTLADWPKASIPKGAFENVSDVEGRIAVNKLTAGTPVLAAELAAPGSGAGLVARIKPGMRAMAIRVDEVIGVGGFILPNSFVDVIAVDTQGGRKPTAQTILQKIEVLAIAQETYTEEGKAKLVRTVTLEIGPKEAEKLALQTNQGPIHLVLRNPLDEPVVEEEKPAVVKVAPVRKAPVPRSQVVAPGPPPYTVEVIRGSKNPDKVKFKSKDSDERL
jgi:pilus assembly protein CpaB